jgi:bifunctional isochorismate lyase / aryl carrier protein
MTIPSIEPYPMPRGDDLPKNRVSWKLDPSRAVLLIHDMQQYFLGHYEIKASPVVELLGNINLIRRRCAASGIPVVYTMQTAQQTPEQRGLLMDVWGAGLTKHPSKEPIVSELTPGGTDTVLTKWRYNAFHHTELLALLHRWRRDQLIICGIYAHIGCLLTACDAFMNDIQPFLVGDATADFSLDMHEMAINYVAQRCGMALSTRDVVVALDTGIAPRAPRDASPSPPLQGSGDAPFSMDRLRSEVSDLLQQPGTEIDDHESLLDLGFDSIRLMTLVERVRSTGVEVTFIELAEQPTLVAWWELVSSRLPHDPKQPPPRGARDAIQA